MTTLTWIWIAGGAAAYLLGSIPFGFLLAKAAGVDIRKVGSGNIGATNVYRSVGKGTGLLTFALDFLKGVAGATLVPWLALRLFGVSASDAAVVHLPLFCGVMTVIGHSWTCFLGFKGGKGVATSVGMLVGVAPLGAGIAFAVWLVTLFLFHYMSVASCSGALALAAAVWVFYAGRPGGLVTASVLSALALLVIWRHRGNIRRLFAGTEPKFSFRKGKA